MHGPINITRESSLIPLCFSDEVINYNEQLSDTRIRAENVHIVCNICPDSSSADTSTPFVTLHVRVNKLTLHIDI